MSALTRYMRGAVNPNLDAHAAFAKGRQPRLGPWVKAHGMAILRAVAIIVTVALVVLAVGWVAGVMVRASDESNKRSAEWKRDPANPVNVCVARGGIPIQSPWDGRIERCDFPPKVTP